jgi:hypothetical protein
LALAVLVVIVEMRVTVEIIQVREQVVRADLPQLQLREVRCMRED